MYVYIHKSATIRDCGSMQPKKQKVKWRDLFLDGCPASSAPMTNSWQASAHQPHLKETHPFTTTNMTNAVMLALSHKQVPQRRDSFGVHLPWPCHLSSPVQISHRCLAQRLWQCSHPEPPAEIGFMNISSALSTAVCFFH